MIAQDSGMKKRPAESVGPGIRYFRSPRICLCKPQNRMIGFGLILTSVLFGFLMLLIGYHFSPDALIVICYVLAVHLIIGMLLIIWCKFNDPENIHSFALTDDGDLYHISIAIPEYVIPMSCRRHLWLDKLMEQQAIFWGVVRYSCSKALEKGICDTLLRKTNPKGYIPEQREHPVGGYMAKMDNPVIEKKTITGATIRYSIEGRDYACFAKLFRHNKGYTKIINHIQKVRKNPAGTVII